MTESTRLNEYDQNLVNMTEKLTTANLNIRTLRHMKFKTFRKIGNNIKYKNCFILFI